MAKKKNIESDFFKLLSLDSATLVVDNDMCYIVYGPEDEETGECESKRFDYGPAELVFLLCSNYGIKAERV
jgi:hypothetical protein